MIAYLSGTVLDVSEDSLILVCGGVGYQVYAALNRLPVMPAVGDNLELYTYMHISGQMNVQSVSLFGFAEKRELQLFNLLNSVSGIGAKTALAVLNTLGYAEVVGAIQMGNAKTLTATPGVGPKAAERILLELKDKIMKLEPEYAPVAAAAPVNSLADNLKRTAAMALTQLGYAQAEAAAYVDTVYAELAEDAALEDIITAALKLAARG